MAKTLYLMRHGETFFNKRRLIQGWCDSPLTERGIAQAELTRDYIERVGIRFDHVYSSPAERACDTAEIMTRGQMPYVRDKGLKEFRYGELEGGSYDLMRACPYGTLYESYEDWLVPFGGDSEEVVGERMRSTLTRIMELPDHEHVLAVAHGACIRRFTMLWNDRNFRKITSVTRNCSLATFIYEDGKFALVSLFEPDDSVLDLP